MRLEEFGEIYEEEAYEAVLNGEIIEKYGRDRPYPSFLIFGLTEKKRPIHCLIAYNKEDNFSIIVTVYQPNPSLWIDYRERRGI